MPCASTGENECLWTDWLLDNSLNGEQARQYACIRRSDTTCSWYRGGPPPEKDFLDMTDPWPVVNFTLSDSSNASWKKKSCFGLCSANLECKIATDLIDNLADFQIWGRLTLCWASVSKIKVVATAMLRNFQHSFCLSHTFHFAVFHRIRIVADHLLLIIKPRVTLSCLISDG